MKHTNKLYLSLGLLLSQGSVTVSSTGYSHNQLIDDANSITISYELTSQLADSENVDEQLHEIFITFFDEQDLTGFSTIVEEIITLLHIKKDLLEDNEQKNKIDLVIKTFEINKYNHSFLIWSKILINPELIALLPEKTRAYLKSIPHAHKATALLRRLKL